MNQDTQASGTGIIIPVDREGRIDADLSCFECRYNLRTQKLDADCPECGRPVEKSVHTNNALLMPPFWLGQVYRGSVCLALAWPLMPVCGIGLIVMLVGILCICDDPPLEQFRVKHLQRWVLGPLLGAGVLFFLTFILASLHWFALITLLGSTAMGVTALVSVHLFARKTAAAARLRAFRHPAMVMAVLSAIAPVSLPTVFIAAISIDPYDTSELLSVAFNIALVLMIGYVLLEIAFWGAFAHSMRLVQLEAIKVSATRRHHA